MHNLLKGGNSREASTNCFDFGKTTLFWKWKRTLQNEYLLFLSIWSYEPPLIINAQASVFGILFHQTFIYVKNVKVIKNILMIKKLHCTCWNSLWCVPISTITVKTLSKFTLQRVLFTKYCITLVNNINYFYNKNRTLI